ncbi:MAG: carbohydrate kinase [Pseudomonadota bacterium]
MLPAPIDRCGSGWAPFAGGAVFNTAIALGRLGVSVGLLTGLSTDNFGQILRAALTEANVDITLAVATDRKTTLAFVTLKDGVAEYSFYDECSATRMLQIEEIPPLPRDVTTLFFGGISLASEPCASALEQLQVREGAGRISVLDPNVRPAFLTDEVGYRARIDRMMRRSDIVKISDEDLIWLFPDDRPLSEKMLEILDHGPSIVVTTLGSEGATAVCRDGVEITVPAKPVPVVDTVGAGDTFNAGFLTKLAEHGDLDCNRLASVDRGTLHAALEYGVAAAAYSVAHAGARPPRRIDLA